MIEEVVLGGDGGEHVAHGNGCGLLILSGRGTRANGLLVCVWQVAPQSLRPSATSFVILQPTAGSRVQERRRRSQLSQSQRAARNELCCRSSSCPVRGVSKCFAIEHQRAATRLV